MAKSDELRAGWTVSVKKDLCYHDEIERLNRQNAALQDTVNVLVKFINDSQPIRHGRWDTYMDDNYIKCSSCQRLFNVIDNNTEDFIYCPNCGAKMDGK